ncbi:hypothetical protein MUK42_02237, partial [Musa troglodytarum]
YSGSGSDNHLGPLLPSYGQDFSAAYSNGRIPSPPYPSPLCLLKNPPKTLLSPDRPTAPPSLAAPLTASSWRAKLQRSVVLS